MMQTVIFWCGIILLLLLFIFLFRKEFTRSSLTAKSVATDGIFAAIILLLGLVPQLGYIQVFPGIALTLNHIPVLIGAALFGWKRGAFYGLLFGVTSLIQAFINGSGLNILFIYPWVSIPPRFLFGLIAGVCFAPLRRQTKIWRSTLLEGGLAFLLTLLHTGLVFGDLFLFYYEETLSFFVSDEIVVQGLGFTFLGALLLGALGEALLAAILVPAVDKGARKAIGNLGRE